MMRQPRIASIAAAEKPLHVVVNWADSTSSIVDLTELVKGLEIYAPLEDPNLFNSVGVDDWGWTAKWTDEIDIGSDTLWRLALEQQGEAMRPDAFREWRERNHLSFADAAQALGLSRRIVIYYEQGKKIVPKTVLLATKGYDGDQGSLVSIPNELLSQVTTAATTSSISVSQWVAHAIEYKIFVDDFVTTSFGPTVSTTFSGSFSATGQMRVATTPLPKETHIYIGKSDELASSGTFDVSDIIMTMSRGEILDAPTEREPSFLKSIRLLSKRSDEWKRHFR